MGSRHVVAWLVVGVVALGASDTVHAQPNHDSATLVTFAKDIAPILQRCCQQCHRPASVAPMSLLT